jgi:hypothetical protein
MKQYFVTQDLRNDLTILDYSLNKEGMEINYRVGDSQRQLLAPPKYASTLMADTGFIERREITDEDTEPVLWVEVLMEGRNGKEKAIWKTWWQFIADGARLSQYWAMQLVLRHEDTALLKQMSWEIGREIVDPKKN